MEITDEAADNGRSAPPPTLRSFNLSPIIEMIRLNSYFCRALLPAILIPANNLFAFAQYRDPRYAPPAEDSIFTSVWFYAVLLIAAGAAALIFKIRRASASFDHAEQIPDGLRLSYKERPAQKPVISERLQAAAATPQPVKKGFTNLPVASFVRVQRSNPYAQLHESNDPTLLQAIDESNVEIEDDASVRMQALKLLSGFRTSNSVAAIAQMALYDLSSKLRSDAVLQLAAIDHESVFETIVTCCADPTREVRASAARALSKLTFDRAEAWTRIVESGDLARMRHAARAAVEGDLVRRYFDRLVHKDRKIAYEAFALTVLLVRSGETEQVFSALAENRDEDVKLAILHVIQCLREERTAEWLDELLTRHNLSPSIESKVNEMRLQFQMHPV